MSVHEKPFCCTNRGCDMKFTNEDRLNVHRKKHDMVLNVDPEKNGDADQTPTPTRFIRNCEELGLFQDLQNVNPFDQQFKEATEASKVGSLHLPEQSADDTLHTPQILPHMESQAINKYINAETDNHPQEFHINNVPAIEIENDQTFSKKAEQVPINNNEKALTSKNNSNIKQKIKEVLKSKLESDTDTGSNKKIPIITITGVSNKTNGISSSYNTSSITKAKGSHGMTDLEKRRALNRAAQLRSRARKKQWVKEMEKELESLKMENKSVALENQNLKNENAALKMILLQHKDCSVSKDPAMIEKTQALLNSPKILSSVTSNVLRANRKRKPVLPVPPPTTTISKIIAIGVPAVQLRSIPTTTKAVLTTTTCSDNVQNVNFSTIPLFATSTTNTHCGNIVTGSEIIKHINFSST